MPSFAAIDFETANHQKTSVCSVGVVIVKNGVITDRIYRLIKPTPNYYSYRNVEIHGLTNADTNNADTFPTVWAEIAPKIEGLPLVAHFKQFDISCLKAAHDACNMDYNYYDTHCTCATAKKLLPQLENHKLPTVAKHFGVELNNHHNALDDAEACANIALKLPVTFE